MNSNKVKLTLVGAGGMGKCHLKDIKNSENAELKAICDTDPEVREKLQAEYGVPVYADHMELFDKAEMDGVIIATPHYDHTVISIEAFKRGINVLTEKPVGVHAADITRMKEACAEARKTKPDLVFAAMFQQRTYGFWQKIKEMIDRGDLGKLIRTTWIITDWFRTQIYYDNGGWRATWEGEGGGVLLNQCPHNLDLYQWMVGMPDQVTGYASIGKYHNIEVEDEVTAYFEYDNGMVGHFITTTGESPGTNRLEIVGELGKLIYENGKLTFYRNKYSMLDQIKNSDQGFATVEMEKEEVNFEHHGEAGHRLIIENFVAAIRDGADLIARAEEGYNSVSIGNAIILSSFEGNRPVKMPIDEAAFENKLKDLIKNSTFKKDVRKQDDVDMNSSF